MKLIDTVMLRENISGLMPFPKESCFFRKFPVNSTVEIA